MSEQKSYMATVGAPAKNKEEEKASADLLLRRSPPPDYLQEWETFICESKNKTVSADERAIVVFRISSEYLAISTSVVGQVTEIKPIHRIPHQRGPIVRGLVNISGQLRMFISVMNFLEIGEERKTKDAKESQVSMMVIERDGDVWAFAVSEVCGIIHHDPGLMQNVPVTVAKSAANYLRGVFVWRENRVGLLDDELLFFSLRRSVL